MGGNFSKNVDWSLIGRDDDVQKAIHFITGKKNFLQICGLRKIGKSRIMSEVYESLKDEFQCLWKDFQYEAMDSSVRCFRVLLKAFEALTNETEEFVEMFPDKTFNCLECEDCQQCATTDKKSKCQNWAESLKKASDMLINSEKAPVDSKGIILFLDNIDKIMDNSNTTRDCFLSFLKRCKSKHFKIIMSSTNKVGLASPDSATLEIDPLGIDDTLRLLYLTTDGREKGSSENIPDAEHMYCEENEVFTPGNKICLQYIARLCDGLPLAAITSGSLLTEYDNMFSPVELLEILTMVRMKTLSPDNCPPEDRLAVYKREMEHIMNLDEQFTSFFNNLNERQSCDFSLDDALSASENKLLTGASIKNEVLKTLLDKCVISVKKLPKSHQWRWHGILREANIALSAYCNVSSEPGIMQANEAVLKYARQNAKLIGLDLDDKALSDPKTFELAIRRLAKLSGEDDTDITGEVTEKIQTAQDMNCISRNLHAGGKLNNLSENENLLNGYRFDENIPSSDSNNFPMNIRVPVEHMESLTINANFNSENNSLICKSISENDEYHSEVNVQQVFAINGDKVNIPVGLSRTGEEYGVLGELGCNDSSFSSSLNTNIFKTFCPGCLGSPVVLDQADKLSEWAGRQRDGITMPLSDENHSNLKMNMSAVNENIEVKTDNNIHSEDKSGGQSGGGPKIPVHDGSKNSCKSDTGNGENGMCLSHAVIEICFKCKKQFHVSLPENKIVNIPQQPVASSDSPHAVRDQIQEIKKFSSQNLMKAQNNSKHPHCSNSGEHNDKCRPKGDTSQLVNDASCNPVTEEAALRLSGVNESKKEISDQFDLREDPTVDIQSGQSGTCALYGQSPSVQNDYSFTGPPGLSYHPPSLVNSGSVNHLLAAEAECLEPLRIDESEKNESPGNNCLSVTNSSRYDSEYGPNAIAWSSSAYQ